LGRMINQVLARELELAVSISAVEAYPALVGSGFEIERDRLPHHLECLVIDGESWAFTAPWGRAILPERGTSKQNHKKQIYLHGLIPNGSCKSKTGILQSRERSDRLFLRLFHTLAAIHSAASCVPRLPPMSAVVFFCRTDSSTALLILPASWLKPR
jgi:hypothetical protein